MQCTKFRIRRCGGSDSGKARAFPPHIRRENVLATQGKYDDADRLYTRTINIQENELGLDHSRVADILHLPASLLIAQVVYI